jgi:sodium/hydrogen exchanger-like protein 6/7
MAQLSENFIFIYLGLSLFTERNLGFNPLFILITVIGICVARWCSVFPLSHLINMVIRYRAQRLHKEPEEIPHSHQVMLFWAGLRGAVGVALAAGFVGASGPVLRATVLVVVVLTVIIFGGTTARMLDILNIKTGVVEEIDSDDEFDIEYVSNDQGIFSRKSGAGIGHNPRRASSNGVALGDLESDELPGAWSTSNGNGHPSNGGAKGTPRRTNSRRGGRGRDSIRRDAMERGLLSPDDSGSASQVEDNDRAVDDDDDFDFDAAADLDLPPAARRIMSMRGAAGSPALPSPAAGSPRRPRTPTSAPQQAAGGIESPYPTSGIRSTPPRQGVSVTEVAHNVGGRIVAATGAVSQLISGLSEDPAEAFRQIDEDFIKPHLLLDPGSGGGGHNGQV